MKLFQDALGLLVTISKKEMVNQKKKEMEKGWFRKHQKIGEYFGDDAVSFSKRNKNKIRSYTHVRTITK